MGHLPRVAVALFVASKLRRAITAVSYQEIEDVIDDLEDTLAKNLIRKL